MKYIVLYDKTKTAHLMANYGVLAEMVVSDGRLMEPAVVVFYRLEDKVY